MKLGVMSALFGGMKLVDALAYCHKQGLDAIELPAGAYPGDPWNLNGIAGNKKKLRALKKLLTNNGMMVQGIACHGNPVHPDKAIARAHRKAHRNAVRLAAEFETVVVNFSGCPAGCATDKTPNFVTCPWPDEFSEAAEYQDGVMTSHWAKEAEFAAKHGVKIAFEAHPGMVVHTPENIVHLRKAVIARIGKAGKNLGSNIDPSHWFWQGIDPVAATRYLGKNKCIFHVHAKDCEVIKYNEGHVGVLDIKSYGDVENRGWVFRTCGYGHGDDFWKPFISTLALYGYDGVLSIEHEDSLMSTNEGFEKAVEYLKGIIIRDEAGGAWWF